MNYNAEAISHLSGSRWREAISSLRQSLEEIESVFGRVPQSTKVRHFVRPVSVQCTQTKNGPSDKGFFIYVLQFVSEASPTFAIAQESHQYCSCEDPHTCAISTTLYNLAFAYHMLGLSSGRTPFLQKSLRLYDLALSTFLGDRDVISSVNNDDYSRTCQDARDVLVRSIAANKTHIFSRFEGETWKTHASAA
jgi:hypothetical protein